MANEASRTSTASEAIHSLEERMTALSLKDDSERGNGSLSSHQAAVHDVAQQVFSQEALPSSHERLLLVSTEKKLLPIEASSQVSGPPTQQHPATKDFYLQTTSAELCLEDLDEISSFPSQDLVKEEKREAKGSSGSSCSQPPALDICPDDPDQAGNHPSQSLSRDISSCSISPQPDSGPPRASAKWVFARKATMPSLTLPAHASQDDESQKSADSLTALPPAINSPPALATEYNSFTPLLKNEKQKVLKIVGKGKFEIELFPLVSSAAIAGGSQTDEPLPGSSSHERLKELLWMSKLIVEREESESPTIQMPFTESTPSNYTEPFSSFSSRSSSSASGSLTPWTAAKISFESSSQPQLLMSTSRTQGALTKKQWLESQAIDWVKNTDKPKGSLANALILQELVEKRVAEEDFCSFFKKVSLYFYKGDREGLQEEAEGVFRDIKAKFLRGIFDPFFEIVVHAPLCSLSGGVRALLSLYREGADQENSALLFTLAKFCMQGWESGTPDDEEALRLYKRAAHQNHPGALFNLGKSLLEKTAKEPDPSESERSNGVEKGAKKLLQAFRDAAERGNPKAQFNLARFILNGWESGSRDENEALRMFKMAAIQGHREALNMVELMQQEPLSCSLSPSPYLLIKKAADLGYMEAQRSYAHFLLDRASAYSGFGHLRFHKSATSTRLNHLWLFAEDDYATYFDSTTLYLFHAFKGHPNAQCALAQCYELGIGINQNINEAIEWYKKAAAFGSQTAKEALDRILSAQKAPFPPISKEREIKVSALASEWKRNLSLFGNEEKNGQILLTLFQKEKVSEEEFANFFMKIGSINQKDSRVLVFLYNKFKQLVESNTLNPTYALGKCYNYGLGVPENEEQAFKYFLKAAAEGDAQSQIEAGLSLCSGIGGPFSPVEGQSWLEKAAHQGVSHAFFMLGRNFELGVFGTTDLEQAASLFKQAANLGHPRALLKLGEWYEEGIGVMKNPDEAFRLYTLLANQGSSTGFFKLGRCHGYGIGVEINPRLAATLFRKSAEMGNFEGKKFYSMYLSHPDTCFEILMAQPCEEALRYLKAAADSGHPEVLLELGQLCLKGTMIEKDLKTALFFFQQAEESKDPETITTLAQIYEQGSEIPKDLVKAVKLYRYAAVKGNLQARQAYARLNQGLLPVELSSKEPLSQ